MYYIYYKKPVTAELKRLDVQAERQYSPDQYEDYKKFTEAAIGIPLKTILIRVK